MLRLSLVNTIVFASPLNERSGHWKAIAVEYLEDNRGSTRKRTGVTSIHDLLYRNLV